ncbi:MAG: thiol:disulfide interchange protein [Gammaproteobacteria bacterium HGW-Gammaproteobacteria-3]|nr:MAG: thiol:disulfide interchange protein [Gammaproteobacteria bacterium HGW-Gammaproteobacteria-3]
MLSFKIIVIVFLGFFSHLTVAADSGEPLPPEQAFKLSAKALTANQIQLNWIIAEGYYLYRSKFNIRSITPKIKLGGIEFPPGEAKHDEFLGDVTVFRHNLAVDVPILKNKSALRQLQLVVQYQGCADIGLCYPPQKTTLNIDLPPPNTKPQETPVKQLLNGLGGIKLKLFEDELLPPDQAFQFLAEVKDGNTLNVNWQIADAYYLYRDKIQLEILNNEHARIGTFNLPRGTPAHDETFGQIEIFRNTLNFAVPLLRTDNSAETITLRAGFQGCADRGVCYPPMEKTLKLKLPATTSANTLPVALSGLPLSEQDSIVQSLHQDTLWLTLMSFFGFGLLLAFTPCVFPMIPILSGIIVGQSKNITASRAFLLSLSYVLASAATYTVFGILAALFGSNLQSIFQQPWIIVLFSAIFVLLAFSMFGFYHLELPKSIQAKLHDSSEKHRDGSLWGAAIMGSLSSLIVGPCVAAPLAGALIYIGQSGDVLLGGSALFAMGLGMGVPLLLLGASAGKWLPKAGPWLNATKVVFGVIMLAVAVWMLDRILPAAVTLFLWALLLIIPAIYLSAIDPLPENASGWRKLFKGIGVVMLIYGVLLLLGLSLGNRNPLQPLQGLGLATAGATSQKTTFTRITSLSELDARLHQASIDNKAVMLDFYADWCISCKEMEAYTFTDPKVRQQLERFVLLQADVTANSAEDQALLKKFRLIGPPAILFFDTDRQEKTTARVIGYQNADAFLTTLNTVQP